MFVVGLRLIAKWFHSLNSLCKQTTVHYLTVANKTKKKTQTTNDRNDRNRLTLLIPADDYVIYRSVYFRSNLCCFCIFMILSQLVALFQTKYVHAQRKSKTMGHRRWHCTILTHFNEIESYLIQDLPFISNMARFN